MAAQNRQSTHDYEQKKCFFCDEKSVDGESFQKFSTKIWLFKGEVAIKDVIRILFKHEQNSMTDEEIENIFQEVVDEDDVLCYHCLQRVLTALYRLNQIDSTPFFVGEGN